MGITVSRVPTEIPWELELTVLQITKCETFHGGNRNKIRKSDRDGDGNSECTNRNQKPIHADALLEEDMHAILTFDLLTTKSNPFMETRTDRPKA